MIFRSWVWFSPPHPPTSVDVMPRNVSVVGSIAWAVCRKSANGASFCQVDIINPVVRSSPCNTSGIQKCRGARPTFKARASVASVVAAGWERLVMLHSPIIHAFEVLANKIVAAAVA